MTQPLTVTLALLAAQFRGWRIGPGEAGGVEAYWESPDGRHRHLHVEHTADQLAVWLRGAGAPRVS